MKPWGGVYDCGGYEKQEIELKWHEYNLAIDAATIQNHFKSKYDILTNSRPDYATIVTRLDANLSM